MKSILSLTTLLVLAVATASTASAAPAQVIIDTGCFRFGPETCDPASNPPSINTGDFHMGEVNPQEGANVPKFRVMSAHCSKGVGPKLSLGEIVEVAGGTAAVVISDTVYQVGRQDEGSTFEVGRYISNSEFSLVSYARDGSTVNPISSVNVKFTENKVIITSASPEIGVCELDAQ